MTSDTNNAQTVTINGMEVTISKNGNGIKVIGQEKSKDLIDKIARYSATQYNGSTINDPSGRGFSSFPLEFNPENKPDVTYETLAADLKKIAAGKIDLSGVEGQPIRNIVGSVQKQR